MFNLYIGGSLWVVCMPPFSFGYIVTAIGGQYMLVKSAGNLSTLFDVGGIIGGILAGYISDKLRARATTAASFMYTAIPAMLLYHRYGSVSKASNIVLMMIAGLLVNGPYALITTAVSADLGTHSSLKDDSRALATVTLIIDGTGSMGAALGPLLTGFLSSKSWDSVFYMLIVGALLLLSCEQNTPPGIEKVSTTQLAIVPCNVGLHWILTVIDPHKESIYLFDPLCHRIRNDSWTQTVNKTIVMYNVKIERRSKKQPHWKIVNGPIQPDSKQCGFFVMRYMKEIIDEIAIKGSISLKSQFYNRTYSQMEIDEVRFEWADFALEQI
ncbi:Major facilitator superfamily protein [Perilla frutescens var. hirtella]|nr:Major facilitator superfamily protein [Perilla frutescens var. hirtella]